jgi:hypothetical protein
MSPFERLGDELLAGPASCADDQEIHGGCFYRLSENACRRRLKVAASSQKHACPACAII